MKKKWEEFKQNTEFKIGFVLRSVSSGKIVSYQSKKRGNSPYVLD